MVQDVIRQGERFEKNANGKFGTMHASNEKRAADTRRGKPPPPGGRTSTYVVLSLCVAHEERVQRVRSASFRVFILNIRCF